ncbi:GNAT family N-acetyltransferase [Tessaracoccus sp. MC1627]|uniref:GNAT family N-acetyltransferase n=1 Tax=Tessaracoccus sp. MC1627 TaxID=2760312 RepID=UPI0015FF5F03|nr:GNAT family N-acetyltransferase [Tessaracoccus sp. MC1627]MBB1511025.1 GNAT family N-acetyltransferase [Tessaracoccus sp. MC1627]
MPVTLRPYRDLDAEPTWQVFHAAVRVTARGDYTPEQLEAWSPDEVDLEVWGRRRAQAWTLVAVEGDRVVGFSDLTDDGVLDMLFVHPDAGGQGVARLLVTAVLVEARRRGLARVVTHASRTARPAFERFGFVVERENTDNWTRGVRVPNFDMHADLPAEPR